MAVRHIAHILMENGEIETYESGAEEKHIAIVSAMEYFKVKKFYSIKRPLNVSKGIYRSK